MQPVGRLRPGAHELTAPFARELQRDCVPVGLYLPQPCGPQPDDGDGAGVRRVVLATVAGVKDPRPCRELRRDVQHRLTAGEQPLGQVRPDTTGPLDRPGALRPPPGQPQHRLIALVVVGDLQRRQLPLGTVQHRHRMRMLGRVDTDHHHVLLPPSG